MHRKRPVFLGIVVGVIVGQILSLSLVYATQDFSYFDVLWAKGLAIENDEGNIAIQLTSLSDGRGGIHMPQGGRLLLSTDTSEQMMFIDVNEEVSRVWCFSLSKGWAGVGVDVDFTGVQADQGDGIIHIFPNPDAPSPPSTAAKPVTWGDVKALQAEFDQAFKR